LAIGGRSPESIALAIIAEIHAFVHVGAGGGRFGSAQGSEVPLHTAAAATRST
jgi:xanthine/CO dehydrogenase XdhC/CoxF family maturation factor